jgi:hypothetical protein
VHAVMCNCYVASHDIRISKLVNGNESRWNGNSRWMMNAKGNNSGIQMGGGMGINERKLEGLGMKK